MSTQMRIFGVDCQDPSFVAAAVQELQRQLDVRVLSRQRVGPDELLVEVDSAAQAAQGGSIGRLIVGGRSLEVVRTAAVGSLHRGEGDLGAHLPAHGPVPFQPLLGVHADTQFAPLAGGRQQVDMYCDQQPRLGLVDRALDMLFDL